MVTGAPGRDTLGPVPGLPSSAVTHGGPDSVVSAPTVSALAGSSNVWITPVVGALDPGGSGCCKVEVNPAAGAKGGA